MSITRRAGCASRVPASTRSDRRGTRATPPSPPRCVPRTRRCSTIAPVASTSHVPDRFPATTASATCSPGCWRWPTSRSRAGATRCSATPTSPSSPRPRRSPRTCPERSVWRSPSDAPSGSVCRRRGPSMRSRSARSGTPAPITRRRRARSTPRGTPPIKVFLSHSCSCARTTAGASACQHHRDGSRPRSATSASSATNGPTAATSPTPTTSPAISPAGYAPTAGRHSCTCARCASWVTPAPTSNRGTARQPRSVTTSCAIRSWARPA